MKKVKKVAGSMKKVEWMKKQIGKINRSHTACYLLLAAILVLGFFLRIYRINDLLGFYYDQGRDALKIWDFWHKKDLFLVGPTTGIAGILRGPYYYYLIAPFYLLGGGNPIWPSVFLSLTTVLASLLTFFLGKKIHSVRAGIIAALISSLSFNIAWSSRWLSNPTPMLLLSMVLVWAFLLVSEGKKEAWMVIAFVSGLSLFSFGSAGEVFYFLAILVFFVWQYLSKKTKKNLPDKKILLQSAGAFLITILPLIVFDLKNNWLITKNIKNFLFGGESFRLVTWREVSDRLKFYWDVFTRLIFHGRYEKETFILSAVFLFFVYKLKDLWKSDGVKISLILLGSLVFGFTFFQGNFGNIYDYYLTGYYLIFVLLLSVSLAEMFKNKFGVLFLVWFFALFLTNNYQFLKYKLTDPVQGENSIAFINQLNAVDWVFSNSPEGEVFNVDTYVPPVLPFAYDYLFLWQGNSRCGDNLCGLELGDQVSNLFTLYEADPSHPERLEAWLERQKGIGQVKKEAIFGGITVQQRVRINK